MGHSRVNESFHLKWVIFKDGWKSRQCNEKMNSVQKGKWQPGYMSKTMPGNGRQLIQKKNKNEETKQDSDHALEQAQKSSG